MMGKSEQDMAYSLLAAAVGGKAVELDVQPATWWSLFRLMQRNHVSALCFEAAEHSHAPREVLLPWMAEREKAIAWSRYQRDVQRDIADVMRAQGVRMLALKGTHFADFYPQPELREFGDLDLYFFDKHQQADRIAEGLPHVNIDKHSHHHTKYNYRGITIESHYNLLNVHYPPSNKKFEMLLNGVVDTAEFDILFLLRHAAVHFASSRLTARDLCDWVFVAGALEQQVDWEMVKQVLRKFGMMPFAEGLNAVAARRLGKSIGHLGCESPWADRMERDVMYGDLQSVHEGEGMKRLVWKLRRYKSMRWKRRLCFSDSPLKLGCAAITSHLSRPYSIMHKV